MVLNESELMYEDSFSIYYANEKSNEVCGFITRSIVPRPARNLIFDHVTDSLRRKRSLHQKIQNFSTENVNAPKIISEEDFE